jgi:predicted solute-binding protein
MLNTNQLFENSRRAGKTTYSMIQHFENRTNYHISLVRKYLDKIIALNDTRLDLAALEEEKEQRQLPPAKAGGLSK